MNDGPSQDNRIPRGALIVVAVGLLACIAAAVLTKLDFEGEAAHLEWVQEKPLADSKPVQVPGGGGEMQLVDGKIQATGTNVSGYTLFRVLTTLRIEKESPVKKARILCETTVDPRNEIARSSNGLRTLYPRSSEGGIYKQDVPETLLVKFSSHGVELAVLEVEDLPPRFTNERGVKVEWPKFQFAHERLKYFLPDGKPKKDLMLPFYSVWKATKTPDAKVACTLETSSGKSTVKLNAALPQKSPPIDEEAEAENEELRQEEDEKAEEAEEQEAEE